MRFAELSKLGPVKLMKIILTFYKADNVTWKMSDQELNKLLFPSSMKMPNEVAKVKRRVKRLIHNIDEKKMREMLVQRDFDLLKDNDKELKKRIREGFGGYQYTDADRLEDECYKSGLLNL